MTLAGLLHSLSSVPSLERALSRSASSADFSAVDGLRAPLIVALLERRRQDSGAPQALLAITATGRESESLRTALAGLAPGTEILEFPAWETLPHERLSPSAETVGRRLDVIRRLSQWQRDLAAGTASSDVVVVAAVRAALQPVAGNLADIEPVELTVGSRGNDLTELTSTLVGFAYSRVDMVTRRGEFAVRGGILDVFSPVAEHPFRVEFFGDEIDQIRLFSVADQRSLDEDVTRASLPPSRELLLTEDVRSRARQMEHEFPGMQEMLAKIGDGIPVDGMESLSPALLDTMVPFSRYLPADTAVAVLAPERVASRAINLAETNAEFLAAAWNAATAGSEAPIDLAGGDFLTLTQLHDTLPPRASWWTISSFQSAPDADAVSAADDNSRSAPSIDEMLEIHLDAVPIPSFSGEVDGAVDFVATRLAEGWSAVLACEGQGLLERASDVLSERGLSARAVDVLPDSLEPSVVYLVQGGLEAGFQVAEASLAVLSESEFYGRASGYGSRQVKKLATRRKNVVDPLALKQGDYVVHQTHGIGRFVELMQREVSAGGGGSRSLAKRTNKVTREYLVLEYASSKRGMPGDKLFVPTDQLDLLSRYVGGEAPALSKMGGSDWSAAKGKARKAVRDIAVELVKLYSARMNSRGHAFGPDTPWQRELEEAFAFVETPDQLTTIDEVKRDMESEIPMDRLLAGDVGYGKTEVAVRAAFKAIQDSKQVVMLVPTTLLVRQHLETFTERFAGFPLQIRALSRFQTAKESKETIAGLADGTVDMVIGTHRLLTDQIAYKDIGLVIIDEEQRFGVEHKDALKKLKTNVDILAMSATPIPRTLEMAVTGIREMSTLATPPEDRHPILTYVGPYSEKQVGAAIRRELLREGQVFFVHNRVTSITRVAAQIAELVPEARVAVAHGKLPEHVLEQVIVDFWERKFDVLVSTTIIETGLDIPNANTLIIDRADKYGLSQLHQLRGRVGRGRERAYAYFLYGDEAPLSETAYDRLQTIAANNDLGGGMQIALKDLEIRGAGNLLGGEQSGHIAGVGFDLYLRMIGEAVDTFRGKEPDNLVELNLELPVDARIPDEYVESERLRLEAYQKLAAASATTADDTQIGAVIEELTDRYGTPPEEVRNLALVAALRKRAAKAGLSEVVAIGGKLRLFSVSLPDSRQARLARMFPGSRYLAATETVLIPLPEIHGEPLADTAMIEWVGGVLTALLD